MDTKFTILPRCLSGPQDSVEPSYPPVRWTDPAMRSRPLQHARRRCRCQRSKLEIHRFNLEVGVGWSFFPSWSFPSRETSSARFNRE